MAPDDDHGPTDAPADLVDGDAGERPAPGPDAPAALSTAPPALSDLRAKDLLNRPREDLEAELDPQTMAELASWFLRPSRIEVEESQQTRGGPGVANQSDVDAFERLAMNLGFGAADDDRAEREAARARAMAAVQPEMMALFAGHERRAATILKPRPDIRMWIDPSILPAVLLSMISTEDGQPAIGEPRVLERSDDITRLLDEDNAPQAVLRDLRRLVEDFERKLEPAFPPPSESEDRTIAIREALRWRPEPIPPREPIPNPREEWRPYRTASWAELVKSAKEIRQQEVDAAAATDTGQYYFTR
jgi:hypothetical protein